MIKKHLHFTILLASYWIYPFMLPSQTYHPIPEENASWKITRCWSFYPGGWHDEYTVRIDGTDTILNGRVYKKVFITTHHLPDTPHDSVYTDFLGGMRQSGKQVFFFSEYLCLDTLERMIYDFNDVLPGDTIFTQVLTNGLTLFIPHIVTGTDSIWIDNSYRQRIRLRDENDSFSETWTGGIGSNMGLIYASYWLLTDNSYDLNCFYQQGELKYENTDPSYGFCTPPLPVIQCDSSITATKEELLTRTFTVYPNPVIDILHINAGDQSCQFQIMDLQGYEVIARQAGFTIDVSSLSPGVYILQIFTASEGGPINKKVIKI